MNIPTVVVAGICVCMMKRTGRLKVTGDVLMPFFSMTGFGRSEGECPGVSWAWEIKSVNGKGLEVRSKLPSGFERLENDVRTRIQGRLRRGNVNVFLSVSNETVEGAYTINLPLLDEIIAAVPDVMKKCPEALPPSVDGLLGIKGVVESVPRKIDDAQQKTIDDHLISGLDIAIEQLSNNRHEEGNRLSATVDERIATIRALHIQATENAEAQSVLLRERIQKGVRNLMESSPPLSEERLAQEAAVLLTKSDIQEELDRLNAHCDAAVELLLSEEPVGRRFDFLCQEFNREANTLCSKAISSELTQVGLALKVVIDQLREQIQNVE